MTTRYYVDTPEALTQIRTVLDQLGGFPKRSPMPSPPASETYFEGALGWTGHLVPEPLDIGDGTGMLELADDDSYLASLLGQSAEIDGATVTVPAADALVSREQLPQACQDWLNAREPPVPVFTPPEPMPEPEPIGALQAQAFGQIDARSDQWFATGFEFAGVRFSLSERAQIRYTNMQIFAESLVPLAVNSLDDTSAVAFTAADQLRNFCLTAMAVVTQIVNDGATQKEIVRGLQTAEELATYQDPRPAPADVPLEPGQGG